MKNNKYQLSEQFQSPAEKSLSDKIDPPIIIIHKYFGKFDIFTSC